jgi:hypothetical protein
LTKSRIYTTHYPGERRRNLRTIIPLSNWTLNSTTMPDERLTSSDPIVGVALNGVLFFTGVSSYGYDAFFPQSYGNMRNP